MADHAAPTQSPKVLAPLVTGIILTAFAAGLAAITPETLKDLGVWALPAYAAITATAGYVTGYLKRDRVREAGAEALATGALDVKG